MERVRGGFGRVVSVRPAVIMRLVLVAAAGLTVALLWSMYEGNRAHTLEVPAPVAQVVEPVAHTAKPITRNPITRNPITKAATPVIRTVTHTVATVVHTVQPAAQGLVQPVAGTLQPVLQPVVAAGHRHSCAGAAPAGAIVTPALPPALLTPPVVPVLETAPRGLPATAVAHVIATAVAQVAGDTPAGSAWYLPSTVGSWCRRCRASRSRRCGGAVPGTSRVVPFARPAPACPGRTGTHFRGKPGSPRGCRRCGFPSWPAVPVRDRRRTIELPRVLDRTAWLTRAPRIHNQTRVPSIQGVDAMRRTKWLGFAATAFCALVLGAGTSVATQSDEHHRPADAASQYGKVDNGTEQHADSPAETRAGEQERSVLVLRGWLEQRQGRSVQQGRHQVQVRELEQDVPGPAPGPARQVRGSWPPRLRLPRQGPGRRQRPR